MVNRGSFQGSRKDFLLAEKPIYREGVLGGFAADALAGIQRRYFKRYPIDLPHEEEPSEDHLLSVDDDAPEEEHCPPDPELLSDEEYQVALKAVEERSKLVTFRKGQIKRWFAYQYMKDSDMDPKESGGVNPYRAILHKLTGIGLTRPRLKTAANVWRKTHRAEVEAETEKRIKAAGESAPKRNQLTTFRDRVARELFTALTEEEKDDWAERAKQEHEAAVEQWRKEVEGPPSQEPADRQRCIQGLVKFAQPILDLIGQATGWSATLIAGGPEPAAGGRLSIISVHSGAMPGDIKMNFGRAERQRYRAHIVPIYSTFLRKCYSIEECRARALLSQNESQGLASLNLDAEGANFDAISTTPPIGSASDVASTSSTVVNSEYSTITSSTAVERSMTEARPDPSVSAMDTPPPTSSAIPCTNPFAFQPPPTSTTSNTHDVALPTSSSSLHIPLPASALPHDANTSPHSRPPSPMQSPPPLTRSPPHSPSPSSLNRRTVPPDSHPHSSADDSSHSRPGSQDSESLVNGEPPAEHDDGANASPTASTADKSNRAKRAAVQPPDLEFDEPRSKRLRSSTSIPTPKRRIPMKARAKLSAQALTSASSRSGQRMNNSKPSAAALPSIPTRRHKTRPVALRPPPVIPVPEVNEKAAAWFKPVLGMFRSEDMGPQWSSLVSRWALFEQRENYQDIGRLSAKRRPKPVGEWIQRARSITYRPVIKDIGVYEEDCRVWWTYIQPAWRVSDGVLALDVEEGDWGVLRRSGTNGIVSVIAALFFWGIYVKKHNYSNDMWDLIVLDCNRALMHLLAEEFS